LFQDDLIKRGLDTLRAGVQLNDLDDFFALFPVIYALTSTPHATHLATRAVLQQFLDPAYLHADDPPQCEYLELRTTPRANEHMTREEYLNAVLDEVEAYPPSKAALLVSVDRRMSGEEAVSVVEAAIKLRKQGRRVVGIDLCGTPDVRRSYQAVIGAYLIWTGWIRSVVVTRV
jgi:adenosine deaminase